MTERGFVTIATGKTHYYKIAKNLLDSYRLNTGGKYPFAIICDRENEYTAAFDKVVLLKSPSHSYLDKLRLFDCLPWEETIFIDADCLVYGDIDRWWRLPCTETAIKTLRRIFCAAGRSCRPGWSLSPLLLWASPAQAPACLWICFDLRRGCPCGRP